MLSRSTRRMLEMLSLIYGTPAKPEDGFIYTDLPDPNRPGEKAAFLLFPVAMHDLEDGRLALVANAQHKRNDGKGFDSESSQGLLNVYLFVQRDGQWQEDRRHENVARMGQYGVLGDVEWTPLGAGRPGFALIHRYAQRGESKSRISLFDLGAPTLRDLTNGVIELASDNDDGCFDETAQCWSISSDWKMVENSEGEYDDLLLTSHGYHESRPRGAKPTAARVRTPKNGASVRYRYVDGQFRIAKIIHAQQDPEKT